MTSATLTTPNEHVRSFITSYAKCWDHFEAYMQDPSHSWRGFIEECRQEAKSQGLEDLKLPAQRTFENRTAKLKQSGAIPERLKSSTPDAVRMRNKRATEQSPKSGECSTTIHRVDSPRSSEEDTFNEFLAPNQGSTRHAPAVGYEYIQSARPDACPVLLECVESLAKIYDIFKHYCVPENESWGYYDFIGLKNQLSHAQAYVIAAIEHREAEDGGSQPSIDVQLS